MNTTLRLRGHLYTCVALTYTIGVTTWNAGIVCCSCIRLPPFCFYTTWRRPCPITNCGYVYLRSNFLRFDARERSGGEKNPYTISFREKKTIEIDRPQSGFQCRNSGIGKAIGLRWLSGPCQIDTQNIIPYPWPHTEHCRRSTVPFKIVDYKKKTGQAYSQGFLWGGSSIV